MVAAEASGHVVSTPANFSDLADRKYDL